MRSMNQNKLNTVKQGMEHLNVAILAVSELDYVRTYMEHGTSEVHARGRKRRGTRDHIENLLEHTISEEKK